MSFTLPTPALGRDEMGSGVRSGILDNEVLTRLLQYLALDAYPLGCLHVHHVGDYVPCTAASAYFARPE